MGDTLGVDISVELVPRAGDSPPSPLSNARPATDGNDPVNKFGGATPSVGCKLSSGDVPDCRSSTGPGRPKWSSMTAGIAGIRSDRLAGRGGLPIPDVVFLFPGEEVGSILLNVYDENRFDALRSSASLFCSSARDERAMG